MSDFELAILQNGQAVQTVPIEGDTFRIGRAPTNHLSVPDETVSWNHAQLWVEGATLWVRDLGSRNGTFVNEDNLRSPRPLKDGDVVRVGTRVMMRLVASRAAQAQELVLLQLEDLTSGVCFQLRPGAFHIGGGEGVHLRLGDSQEHRVTLYAHEDGEVWLHSEEDSTPIAHGETFTLFEHQLRVGRSPLDHAPTVEFGADAYDYHLLCSLDGPRGPFAVLTDGRSGRTFEAHGNRAVLLYLLGRQVLGHRKQGLDDSEVGWCSDSEISVGIWGRGGGGKSGLNVLVHRLRKSLEASEIDPWFIEKRRRGVRARLTKITIR